MKDIHPIIKFSAVFFAYMAIQTVTVAILVGIPTDPVHISLAFGVFGALPAAAYGMYWTTKPWTLFGERD
ncbi:hypothetical protein [Xanthomonas arboricola]|uniref:hypothetical protein n=1 Tax=Xanthomonas TaxID=338 RepID=UPI00069E8A42|nr:hypothetical protein [Xanthomonas arboricola]KOB19942.1 hypothetical protein AE925_05455 [Xanthomonas arboricola]KOB45512.1 hypothetical protein AE931_05190 [Xanthomonas arboricola]